MSQLHYDSDSKFVCPICGNTKYPLLDVGSDFPVVYELQIIGAGNRAQKCHDCKSSDRDRLAYLYFKYEGLFQQDMRSITLLHIAPEDCIAQEFRKNPKVSYLAVDSFEHGYTYPSYIQEMNILDLCFPNDHFDWLICNHVLQDIQDDLLAMKEILRVLKPGGKAMLQVPISPKLKNTLEYQGVLTLEESQALYGQRFHKRVYSKQGFTHKLKTIGFEINVFNISEKYPQHGLNPFEDIYIGIKREKYDSTSK